MQSVQKSNFKSDRLTDLSGKREMHVQSPSSGRISSVCFTRDDLQLFGEVSYDQNPRHLSLEWARRTVHGQPVVFGILGAFACLGEVKPPQNCTLSQVNLEFQQAMLPGIEYAVIVREQSPRSFSVALRDGRNVLLKADFVFAETGIQDIPWGAPGNSLRQVPAEFNENETAAVIQGIYLPNVKRLAGLLTRFGIDERLMGRPQLSALLWSSYFVGMEQPGLRALFHKLSLTFDNLQQCRSAALSYETKVVSINAFGSIRSQVRLCSDDQLVASGEVRAYIMPRHPTSSAADLEALLPRSDALKGRVAVVVGASRGLGATLAMALALQGCDVLATYNHSEAEARRLQEALAEAPGSTRVVQGDASDLGWCRQLATRVLEEFGRLDFLICNACPPLLPLWLEPEMVGRINSYVAEAVSLVSVPLSVFSQIVTPKSGWSVIISSEAIETTPREWPHYVATKCAVEGLARVAAVQYPDMHYLVVRPPRMKTDLVNGPSNAAFGKGEEVQPEGVAARIVQRLLRPPASRVEILTLNFKKGDSEAPGERKS